MLASVSLWAGPSVALWRARASLVELQRLDETAKAAVTLGQPVERAQRVVVVGAERGSLARQRVFSVFQCLGMPPEIRVDGSQQTHAQERVAAIGAELGLRRRQVPFTEREGLVGPAGFQKGASQHVLATT